MRREAQFDGQFYPGSAQELKKHIKILAPAVHQKKHAYGIISPHAGYMYSGVVSGKVLSAVDIADTVVMLGPNHTGIGNPIALFANGCWQTPLGEVDIDAEISNDILSSSDIITDDADAHTHEHSLEVILPFLQYLKPSVKIVPMLLGTHQAEILSEVACAIAESIIKASRHVQILASSDLTHYQPHDVACKKDRLVMDAVLALDADRLLDTVARHQISMCGIAPVFVMIKAALILGAAKSELIYYQTSGDASGDLRSVVGYAGMILY